MKQTRKTYTHEFKDMIVAQLKEGARVIDLSRLYNISDKTIQQWKSDSLKWKDEEGARKKVSMQSYNNLKKENQKLKEEVEFLKKAWEYMKGGQ